MSLLDAIAPPDTAFVEGRWLPRITVRPKNVEPPPGLGHASQSPADASGWTDNTPPARTDLFDDIVPPAGPEHAPPLPADASDETENAASARTGRLFDDIVPPADTPAPDIPASGGGQFAAPLPDGRNFRVAREGISPPAGFVDRLATMWENPPKDRPSLIGLIKSTYEAATLPGDVYSGKTPITGPDGHTSDEVIARAKDLAQVSPLRSAPGGMFGRPIRDRVANPFPKAERALGDEAAAAPHGTVAPTVPPAPPRQIFAPEQGVPIPRSGPQPPARPPDKAAAQSDRMNSGARESGPFSLGGTEQHALGSGQVRTGSIPPTGIPQVTANKKAGDAFRDKLAAELRAAGREVRIEVYKPTPYGGRYMDLDVWMNGKNLGGIEAKVGSSRYTPSQQLKDWWLKRAKNYTVHVVRDR